MSGEPSLVIPKQKKRGRKATIKYYSSTIRNKLSNTSIEDATKILHIDIKDNEEDIEYDQDTDSKSLKKLYENQIADRQIQDENFNTNRSISELSKKKDESIHHENGYFMILDSFKAWPKTCSVLCWNCAHTFDTTPIGIPVGYYKELFRTTGIFCSFPCMIRYTRDRCIFVKHKPYISHMFKCLMGRDFDDRPAPEPCTLEQFGGKLSIQEYRNAVDSGKMYKFVKYPMFVSRDYIELVDIKNVKEANNYVFNKQKSESSKKVVDISNFLKQDSDKK